MGGRQPFVILTGAYFKKEGEGSIFWFIL
jgi:hypothetical protein